MFRKVSPKYVEQSRIVEVVGLIWYDILERSVMEKKVCGLDGCDDPFEAKGLCKNHYYKLQRYGNPRAGVEYRKQKPACWAPGCPETALIKGPGKGACRYHWYRIQEAKYPVQYKRWLKENGALCSFCHERIDVSVETGRCRQCDMIVSTPTVVLKKALELRND